MFESSDEYAILVDESTDVDIKTVIFQEDMHYFC